MIRRPCSLYSPGPASAVLTARRSAVLLLVGVFIAFQNIAFARETAPACYIDRPDSSSAVVSLSSRPPGADVRIDDSISVKTPAQVSLVSGRHILLLTKEGCVPSRDTVLVSNAASLSVDDSLFMLPVVSIRSTPGGARLTVDSLFFGRTPIDSLVIQPGRHVLKLNLPEYRDKSEMFEFSPGSVRTLSFNLMPSFGYVSIEVSPSDSRVAIDGGEVSLGSVEERRIPFGMHTIVVSHPATAKSLEDRFYLFPANSKAFDARLEGFTFVPAIRSALIPGLGQVLDGDMVKGSIEFLGTLISGFLVYDLHRAQLDRQADLVRAQSTYDLAATEQQALAARGALVQAASSVTRAKNSVTAAAVALAAVYVLQIADALVFNSTMHDLSLKSDIQVPLNSLGSHDGADGVKFGVKVQF
jgi:hypothetical protein